MSQFIVGIDPGICGAIALYDGDELLVFDMPVHHLKVNNKNKRRIDVYELARIVDEKSTLIKKAFIESPSASPGMGVVSSFQFGFSCGVVQTIIAAHFISAKLLHPAKWKKIMELPASKDACRKRASELMPKHCDKWSRVMDDGRAEAALMAYGGFHNLL